MYAITRAINEYDQDGEYLFSVFDIKPTREELRKLFFGKDYSPEKVHKNVMNRNEKFITRLLNGGGREKAEHVWYYLIEISSGEKYERG